MPAEWPSCTAVRDVDPIPTAALHSRHDGRAITTWCSITMVPASHPTALAALLALLLLASSSPSVLAAAAGAKSASGGGASDGRNLQLPAADNYGRRNPSCSIVLAKECLAARTTGGFGGCEFCAGSHAKDLHDAGCLQPQITSFCNNSAPSPGPPAPPNPPAPGPPPPPGPTPPPWPWSGLWQCSQVPFSGRDAQCMRMPVDQPSGGVYNNSLCGGRCQPCSPPTPCPPPPPPPPPGPADPQCSKPYSNVSDAWRAVTNWHGAGPGGKTMGDLKLGDSHCNQYTHATGVGGGGWFRFVGAGGDALSQYARADGHCGTDKPGFLSAWNTTTDGVGTGCNCGSGDSCTGPPCDYNSPGSYPAWGEGVVEMIVCFDFNSGCGNNVPVGLVQCDGFLLFRLPYTPDCFSAYCTDHAESGERLTRMRDDVYNRPT